MCEGGIDHGGGSQEEAGVEFVGGDDESHTVSRNIVKSLMTCASMCWDPVSADGEHARGCRCHEAVSDICFMS